MENQSNIESLLEKTNDYLETRFELFKLKAVNKSSELVSSATSKIILGVILIFFIILLNIGIAIWLGDIMGKMFYGFFTVAEFKNISL